MEREVPSGDSATGLITGASYRLLIIEFIKEFCRYCLTHAIFRTMIGPCPRSVWFRGVLQGVCGWSKRRGRSCLASDVATGLMTRGRRLASERQRVARRARAAPGHVTISGGHVTISPGGHVAPIGGHVAPLGDAHVRDVHVRRQPEGEPHVRVTGVLRS